MEKLVGQLCMAANKAGVELTAWEIYRLAAALESELAADAKTNTPTQTQEKEKAREPKIAVYEESIPMTEAVKWLEKDKDQEPVTDSKIESVNAPAETPAPEQPKPAPKVSKPEPVKEKTSGTDSKNELPPRQKQLWDYVQAHPDENLNEICQGMDITTANYYFLKRKLKDKGYIIPNKSTAVAEKHGRNILKNIKQIQQQEKSDMDKRMEDAYMGEHVNIQPDPVPKKPVSAKAQELYEYMQSHPDSRMPKTCEDLNITSADYYMLKAQLKKNGWIESAVENVRAY